MATKSHTKCEEIETQIAATISDMETWQYRLEKLRRENPPVFEHIHEARATVEDLKNDLSRLKAQQQSEKCLPGESTGTFQDNQSILQTSSVRKKDSRALEIVRNDAGSQQAK